MNTGYVISCCSICEVEAAIEGREAPSWIYENIKAGNIKRKEGCIYVEGQIMCDTDTLLIEDGQLLLYNNNGMLERW